ncbi:hypothetical protein FQR65_LT05052 [Abscondita terminalis]|nr:hypothetical protein FQR65_LT05052 [Abscondita terminalis]
MKFLLVVLSVVVVCMGEEVAEEEKKNVKRGVLGYTGYASGYGYGLDGHYSPVVSTYVEPVVSKISYGYKPYSGYYGGYGHGYGLYGYGHGLGYGGYYGHGLYGYGHGLGYGYHYPWYGYHGLGHGHYGYVISNVVSKPELRCSGMVDESRSISAASCTDPDSSDISSFLDPCYKNFERATGIKAKSKRTIKNIIETSRTKPSTSAAPSENRPSVMDMLFPVNFSLNNIVEDEVDIYSGESEINR